MKLNARQIETAKPKDKAYKMADGGGLYLEVSPRGSILRVIQLVNSNATAGGYSLLSQRQINDILSLYPDISTAA